MSESIPQTGDIWQDKYGDYYLIGEAMKSSGTGKFTYFNTINMSTGQFKSEWLSIIITWNKIA